MKALGVFCHRHKTQTMAGEGRDMKEIKAYIRQSHINQVVEKLLEADAPGITIVDVHPVGYGYDPNYFESRSLPVFERHKHWNIVKLEVVCADEEVERLVQVIQEHSRIGERGDGMIFLSEIFDAVRIRDGKRGREAL